MDWGWPVVGKRRQFVAAVGDAWHQNFERTELIGNLAYRLAEQWQQPADDGAAAARQHGDDGPGRRQGEPDRQRTGVLRPDPVQPFQDRVTGIGARRSAKARVGFRLERQQRQKMIDIGRHFPGAARTPGPNRRRYIINNRNIRPLAAKPLGDLMGEIGAVDNQQHMRVEGPRRSHRLIDAAHNQRQTLDYFAKAHDGDFGHREHRGQSLRQHVLAADAAQDQTVSQPLTQHRQQLAAQPVARVLACHHE